VESTPLYEWPGFSNNCKPEMSTIATRAIRQQIVVKGIASGSNKKY